MVQRQSRTIQHLGHKTKEKSVKEVGKEQLRGQEQNPEPKPEGASPRSVFVLIPT